MDIKLFFIILSIILLFDIVYLTLNKKLYDTVFDRNKLKIHFGLVAWIMMAFSLYYFVLSNLEGSIKDKVLKGALLGLCIYSIYNFTNLAIFDFYHIKLAVIDTMWGTFLFGVIVYLVSNFYRLD